MSSRLNSVTNGPLLKVFQEMQACLKRLTVSKLRVLGLFAGLVVLCSCATKNSTSLPPETNINPEAGRGGLLLVILHLEHGEELPFLVDTGGPFCLLDQSLEPVLGKPLRKTTVHSIYGATPAKLYKAPQLYLGNVALQTGGQVATLDFKRLSDDVNALGHSHYRIMGLLGMDCLRNYCVQLDFKSRKMRFLDPNPGGGQDWGPAVPLTISHFPCRLFVRGNLAGYEGCRSLVDSGMNFDGDTRLKPTRKEAFFQAYWRTNMVYSDGTFAGYSYTNLYLGNGQADVIGLGFLSRNLATFDFPARTMYLKQQSVGPLDSSGKSADR